jgi:glutamate formiminotransferase
MCFRPYQNIIKNIKDVTLLDFTADTDHNRTDVTFIGAPEAVKKQHLTIALKCVELIDMNKHKGEHPRMGRSTSSRLSRSLK